jgi:hypothetical protein
MECSTLPCISFGSDTWSKIKQHTDQIVSFDEKAIKIKAIIAITSIGLLLLGYSNPFGLAFTATLVLIKVTKLSIILTSTSIAMHCIPYLLSPKKCTEEQGKGFLCLMYNLTFNQVYEKYCDFRLPEFEDKSKIFELGPSDWVANKLISNDLLLKFYGLNKFCACIKAQKERIVRLDGEKTELEKTSTSDPALKIRLDNEINKCRTIISRNFTEGKDACIAFVKEFINYHNDKKYQVFISDFIIYNMSE